MSEASMSDEIGDDDLLPATEAIANIYRHVVLAPDVDAYLDKNAQYIARVAVEAYIYAQAELDAADEATEDMRVAGRDILRAWISSDKMHSLESVVQRIYTEMQAARKARRAL